MNEIRLLEHELQRARELYPQPVDMVRFLGAAHIKVSSLQAKCHHHAMAWNKEEQHYAKVAMLELAVICLRAIETLGGINEEKYKHHTDITKKVDRSYAGSNAEG